MGYVSINIMYLLLIYSLAMMVDLIIVSRELMVSKILSVEFFALFGILVFYSLQSLSHLITSDNIYAKEQTDTDSKVIHDNSAKN